MKHIIQYILKILSSRIIKKYNPRIVGITGSVGKTTAKEAIKSVLVGQYNVRANIKNYNNEIGVPLTIIGTESPRKSILGWVKVFASGLKLILVRDENYPEILILEMGADKIGDIEYLVSFVPCDIGVVTNVSEAHMEFFGTLQKVQEEKRKIVEHLKQENFAILNYDVDLVRKMTNNTEAKVVTFGFEEGADAKAGEATIDYKKDKPDRMAFKLKYKGNVVPVFMPKSLGYAQIYSALAAVAVADIFGVNLLDITKALKKFNPPRGRMNLIKGIKETLILDDTYNSSPASVRAALEIMREINLPEGAKRFAVLGDMLELGNQTAEKHREAGVYVVESGVDILITRGEAAREMAHGAIEAGMSKDKIFSFADNESAGMFLQERMRKGDLILVKGSQGMRMEKIVKEIIARPLMAGELLVRQGEEWR